MTRNWSCIKSRVHVWVGWGYVDVSMGFFGWLLSFFFFLIWVLNSFVHKTFYKSVTNFNFLDLFVHRCFIKSVNCNTHLGFAGFFQLYFIFLFSSWWFLRACIAFHCSVKYYSVFTEEYNIKAALFLLKLFGCYLLVAFGNDVAFDTWEALMLFPVLVSFCGMLCFTGQCKHFKSSTWSAEECCGESCLQYSGVYYFSQWLIVSNIRGVCLRSCVHVRVYSCCICHLLLRMIEANLSMSEWLDLKDPMLIAYSPKFQLGFNDNNHWIKSISWAILFKSSIFDALLRWFWSSNWGKFWAICNLCKCLLVHPPCASASWSGPTTWIGLLS